MLLLASLGLAAREDNYRLPPSRDLHDGLSLLPNLGAQKTITSGNPGRCRHPYRHDQSALNTAHRYLSRSVCAQALWFDSFFGDDESADTADTARTFVRLSHTETLRWEEELDQNSSVRARARVYLPTAEKRFGIILSGESKEDSSTLGDTENVSGTAPTRDEGNVTATFRWAKEMTNALGLDLDVSARFSSGKPIGIVSTKFRQSWDAGATSSVSLREEFFWRTDDEGFGVELRGSFNHRINQTWLYSADSELYHSEDSEGWEWDTATGFSQKWRPRTAIIYSVGANGQTQPDNITENYGISVRLRRNIHDGWLFFELQPRLDFPQDRNRKATPAVAFRLEAHFGMQ